LPTRKPTPSFFISRTSRSRARVFPEWSPHKPQSSSPWGFPRPRPTPRTPVARARRLGREHHRLRLHRGVDHNTGEIGRLHRVRPGGHRQALLQQRLKLLFPHPLAPPRQRRAVKYQCMLEKLLAAEVLEVRVLHPAIAQSLVGKVVSVLEDCQSRHQPRRQRRLTRLVGVDRPEPLFQKTPVDRPRQLHQRVVHVDDLIKPRAEQILLAGLPSLAWSHRKFPAPSARARGITACDSKESSKPNLQGSRPATARRRQIRLLKRAQSSKPFNSF
jgi:hypothetical protein